MTISSEINRSGPYFGNGVTDLFDYKFKVVDEAHIKVIRAEDGLETILELGVDYTVIGVGSDAGGQIETTIAPIEGQSIIILRNIPFVQETDLENQGAYYAETLERALDLALMRDQQLSEKIDRAIVIPATSDFSDLEVLVGGVLRLSASADNVDKVAAAVNEVSNVSENMASVLAASGNADAAAAAALATAADRVQTGQDRASAAASKSAGEAAQAAAEGARDTAVSAKNTAVPAKDTAVAAALAAEDARDTAITARDAAVVARGGAENARDTAVAAEGAAVIARGGAENARDAAVAARIFIEAWSALLPATLVGQGGKFLAVNTTEDGYEHIISPASDPWRVQPIGVPIPVFDNLFANALPSTDQSYRYILLTAGEGGAGKYNAGVLTSESVSGSAPLVSATAVISLAGSPLNGKTVRLINTERRFLRAGSPGVDEDDQMQLLTGDISLSGSGNGLVRTDANKSGVFSANGASRGSSTAGTATGGRDIRFNSSLSPDARTGDETRPKNVGVTYVMRVL